MLRPTGLLAVVALLAAGSATAAPHRALPNCVGKPQVAPRQVILACADANFLVRGVQWLGWGGARAVGIGTAVVNDCKPYCAAGRFHDYPALLVASGSQRCPGGALAYRTVAYAFVGPSPFPPNAPGTIDPRQTFPCR